MATAPGKKDDKKNKRKHTWKQRPSAKETNDESAEKKEEE